MGGQMVQLAAPVPDQGEQFVTGCSPCGGTAVTACVLEPWPRRSMAMSQRWPASTGPAVTERQEGRVLAGGGVEGYWAA